MKPFRKVALFACMVLCAGLAFAKGEKIEAGSAQDPFVGTSWVSKGVEVLSFKGGGKVEYGFSEKSYSLEKDGESYAASFKVGGVKIRVAIDSKDSKEAACKTGIVEFTAQKK